MNFKIILCLVYIGWSSYIQAKYAILPPLECHQTIQVDGNDELDSLSLDQLECLLVQKIELKSAYEDLRDFINHLNKKRVSLQNQSKYVDCKQVTILMIHAWQSIDSLEQYAKRLTTLAYYHFRLGEIFDCYSYSLQALEIGKEHNFVHIEERALSRLAWSNWRIKRYEEAIKLNDDRKSIVFDKLKTDSKKYAWFNSAGTFYNNIKDYSKAQFYGDSAIYYAEKIKSSRAISLTKSNMSFYFEGTDSIQYRMSLINEALEINRKNKNKEQLGANLGLIAYLQSIQKLYSQAENNYKLSLELANEIGDKPRQRIALEGLATVYDSMAMYQKAYYYQQKAHILNEELYGGASLEQFFDLEQTLFQKENKQLKAEQEIKDLKIKQERRNLFFISSLLILGSLGIWLYFRNKIRSQKRKRERLDELHNIKIKNLEMESLRSQMNPHFIFNCLNSIKGYISTNEPRVATRFLNKFSKLIRMILSHSKKKTITLQEEIDALVLYIELENLRLSNDLNYIIEVEEGIDTMEVTIPPLIIQPFVENAIWHGLARSNKAKDLRILIERKEHLITIQIIDNGVGRNASRHNQTTQKTDHKSYGINITKGRIALANKNKVSVLNEDEVRINDLVLPDGSPGGTEVTLFIKP